MADFNEQLPQWEKEGIQPPEDRRTTVGWEVQDKPPASWFNWFFNRVYKVLQELQGNAVHEEDFSTHKAESASETDLGHVKVDGATIFSDENGVISTVEPTDSSLYYLEGNEFASITGGWTAIDAGGTGTTSKESDHLYLEVEGESATRRFITDNTIDLTEIDYLKCRIDQSGAENPSGTIRKRYTLRVTTSDTGGGGVAEVETIENGENIEIALDVRGITGSYYITVWQGHTTSVSSGASWSKTYKIWGV